MIEWYPVFCWLPLCQDCSVIEWYADFCWLPLCQVYPVIERYACVLLVATMSGLSCD